MDGNHGKVQPTVPASRLRPETRKAGLLGPPAVIQPQALCSVSFGTVRHVFQPHCNQQKRALGYRQARRLREAPRVACWLGWSRARSPGVFARSHLVSLLPSREVTKEDARRPLDQDPVLGEQVQKEETCSPEESPGAGGRASSLHPAHPQDRSTNAAPS